jgi:hypothetical protein
MKHMHAVDRPICEVASSVETISAAVRTIYHAVDCADCLRRALAEAEERANALRELLWKVEAGS